MPDDGDRVDGAAELHAEIDRLRALVGPNEQSYAELRDEIDRAQEAVRDAELDAGRLRGTITEMRLELHRARQDQFHLQRVVLRPASWVVGRFQRFRRRWS